MATRIPVVVLHADLFFSKGRDQGRKEKSPPNAGAIKWNRKEEPTVTWGQFRGHDTPFLKEVKSKAAGNADKGKVPELNSEGDERIKTLISSSIKNLDSIRIRFLLVT